MGSIVMHLCIANEVSKVINVDKKKFVIGSIAPDIYKSMPDGTNTESHYLVEVEENGKKYRLPDLMKFVEENKEQMKNDDYVLGYYAHLIADKNWYKNISAVAYSKFFEENHAKEEYNDSDVLLKQKYKALVYREYVILNRYFIEKYNLSMDYLYKLVVNDEDNKDDDVEILFKENIIMVDDISNIENKLKILKLETIENWINNSINEVINEIKIVKG